MGFTRTSLLASVLASSSLCFLQAQTVHILETRADGTALLAHHEVSFTTTAPDPTSAKIVLDDTIHFQRMEGFGASLTDSSATVLMQLPAAQRDSLMQEMFAPAGPLGLTLLRQPLGASDFSAHGDYSYDDPPDAKPDPALSHFNITADAQNLFPLLRDALHLNPQIHLFLLPWSAPAWMKDSHSMHAGSLETKYIPTYAQYLARTVEAYAQQGLPTYALALQNEPLNENPSYPTQKMDPIQEAHLAAALQPLLSHNGRNALLLGYEHNWNNLDYPTKLLAEASQLTAKNSPPLFAGISFHCYAGTEAAQLAFFRDHPTIPLWFTECSGTNGSDFAGDLLWQAHHLILGAPLNEASSVLIWNLVLNAHGDPHNGGCGDCRALFTVESHAGTFSIKRNVEYYELAHISPFVHPGAVRIAALATTEGLQTVAFQNPDSTTAVLILNSAPHETLIALQWHGQTAAYIAPARSLLTLTWGTPIPVLSDGTYRIATSPTGDHTLEAHPGTTPDLKPSSDDPTTSARQLWTLHRLSDNHFEIRNVATAQSLALSSGGKLVTLSLDGQHIAPLILSLQADGVCLATAQKSACTAASITATGLHAGDFVYLIAPVTPKFN